MIVLKTGSKKGAGKVVSGGSFSATMSVATSSLPSGMDVVTAQFAAIAGHAVLSSNTTTLQPESDSPRQAIPIARQIVIFFARFNAQVRVRLRLDPQSNDLAMDNVRFLFADLATASRLGFVNDKAFP